MSVINFKEDCVKTNITMEEGDSSLEPGEVKTPPHASESSRPSTTNQQKVHTDDDDDAVMQNEKCNKSPIFVDHPKSASKQETDKCAEKVRAILELDAIRRKEERERKKEQKCETSLHKSKSGKKKEHKKHKSSKHAKKESRKRKHPESENAKEHGSAKKKSKNKKKKHDEHKSFSSQQQTPTESYEQPMRPMSSAVFPPMDYSTPMLTAPPANFAHSFSGYPHNNRPYHQRTQNPFIRNYRTDFRHRGNDFTPHGRGGRFPRYRNQYTPGFYHHAPPPVVEESANRERSPTANNSGMIAAEDLMWTKTKPSISFTYNIQDRHTKVNKTKKERKISDHSSGGKKKKHKKSKEREHSNKSSPKLSHKSSKRKKIRQIRKTLQSSLTKKQRTLSSSHESAGLTGEDDEGNTPTRDNNTPEIVKNISEQSPNSPKYYLDKKIKIEKEDVVPVKGIENEKSTEGGKSGDAGKSQETLDMFASLTPPKQKSPLPPTVEKSITNSHTSNIKITNKLQEIQCRVDKLLEDDDLKLEAIQATKHKLLQQKTREHNTDNDKQIMKKRDTKKTADKDSTPHRQRSLEKHAKQQRSKSVDPKSKRDSKPKDREKDRDMASEIGAYANKKENKKGNKKHAKVDKELTPPLRSHSKTPTHHKNKIPYIKVKQEKDCTPPREMKKVNIAMLKIKTEKLTPPLEDSDILKKSAICANDSSPDTDDYSDNWENDDEEVLMSSTFLKINQSEQLTKNGTSRSPSLADSVGSASNSKLQSTTPKNSPPPQARLSPPQTVLSPTAPPPQATPEKSTTPPKIKSPKADDTSELSEMQLLYNQFIKSVESADLNLSVDETAATTNETETSIAEINKASQLSTSYSSTSSSSSSDTSVSSSGSSSTTSSSDSASEDSNDAVSVRKRDKTAATVDKENLIETNVPTSDDNAQTENDSQANIAKDMKKLENLEANLLRIQMMRANYDSADEISDELLKMEKLFLHEKNLILNKFKHTSSTASIKCEKETDSDATQTSAECLQLRGQGQFVQSMQKLPNKDDPPPPQITNIFDIKRDVIKLTISPVKLPKTSAIFEADNELDNNAKQETDTHDNNSKATTVKQTKPIKEVAIVKPIMETKESSTHHQQQKSRRRSPFPTHHSNNNSGQARSRSRRGARVRSLSVSPTRNNNNGQQRRGGFSKQSRNRNFDRRSRSRSPSGGGGNRQYNRRSGDISPMSRKRRPFGNVDDRFRSKHSPPRRDSRSRSRSRTPPRHRFDRYSRSPLPFKPPSPPTDPNSSPTNNNNNIRRSSLSPDRHLRSLSRSPPRKRTPHSPPPSNKSYDSNSRSSRHRSLSPKQQGFYKQQQQQHAPSADGSTSSYYFNQSPSRISLDARINIVLNGPNDGHNENSQHNNTIAGYDDYSHYGQYGPAAYMSLPNDPNSFYANQYMAMANAGVHGGHHTMQQPYGNLPIMGSDDPNMYASMQQHAAANYYYNRFGTQQPTFGMNQPSPLLKELPKASSVAVQKGNVLEIVPCNDISAASVIKAEKDDKKVAEQEVLEEQNAGSNNDNGNRSILKPLEGEPNTVRAIPVGPPKKKKVNFEDGVYPNHNSDEEDRKVIEAKMRVKMRRLRKKLGITPQCQSLLKEKVRKKKQKENLDKKAPPPPPPGGMAPPNLEQPIYLRSHTPTPLLYFHFDSVVHSMYVSQMERPIPPRLLNPKCLTATATNNIAAASSTHHTDSQSPLYMQSPINPANKKDPIAAFTRPNRNENLSPKVMAGVTAALHQQTAAGSPKINFKIYSPIDNISNTEIGHNAIMASASPNNIKSSTTTAAPPTNLGAFLSTKRQESPKDAGVNSTRTNIAMGGGLLPMPVGHPQMSSNIGIAPQARIPVIGVPPTVIPKVISSVSEPFMSGGFAPTMQTSHHHMNHMNIPNTNYQMGIPAMTHTYNPNMHLQSGVPQQQFYNSPIQRMHRPPLPNYMVQQHQQAQSSPSNTNLPPGHHMMENLETNADMDKFASPQSMTNPFNYKAP